MALISVINRTHRQTTADRLDAEIIRLVGALEGEGYDRAAQHVLRARSEVRADMHPDDLVATEKGGG